MVWQLIPGRLNCGEARRSVSAAKGEPQPHEPGEIAAGQSVTEGDDEQDRTLDWLVDDQPGDGHYGQAKGAEQASLSADAGEEHQDDEHDGRGEQGELGEQLIP